METRLADAPNRTRGLVRAGTSTGRSGYPRGVLAPAGQTEPGAVSTIQRAEVVVAVDGGADTAEAVRTAQRIGAQLGSAGPSRPAALLLLSEGAPPPMPPEAATPGGPPLLAWSHPGQSALEATLRAAERFGAAAAALVVSRDDHREVEAHRLIAPVVDGGFDLVCPWYASHRFDAVIHTALVTPTLRALFGRRLRRPLGSELALSRRAVSHLLGDAWLADPTRAGDPMWLLTAVLSRDLRVAQVHLGAPPPRREAPALDLAAALASVVGRLFHEVRLHAPTWQRVKGAHAVPSFGDGAGVAALAADARPPPIAPMVAAFQLGYRELGHLWGTLLPPHTLLALKHLSRQPEERFAIDDTLWARIVFDFAVGYHLATLDRAQLLRAMVPLYLGWAAGFVREVCDLAPAAVDERTERLGRAFEVAKPYLISRWRWPDRFNP